MNVFDFTGSPIKTKQKETPRRSKKAPKKVAVKKIQDRSSTLNSEIGFRSLHHPNAAETIPFASRKRKLSIDDGRSDPIAKSLSRNSSFSSLPSLSKPKAPQSLDVFEFPSAPVTQIPAKPSQAQHESQPSPAPVTPVTTEHQELEDEHVALITFPRKSRKTSPSKTSPNSNTPQSHTSTPKISQASQRQQVSPLDTPSRRDIVLHALGSLEDHADVRPSFQEAGESAPDSLHAVAPVLNDFVRQLPVPDDQVLEDESEELLWDECFAAELEEVCEGLQWEGFVFDDEIEERRRTMLQSNTEANVSAFVFEDFFSVYCNL